MMIPRKAVIPVAGLGTRLLPFTKEQPKEMLPVFSRSSSGRICLKPLVQMIFEKLHDAGFREFCFIVGRGKRSIEDHFALDNDLLKQLTKGNKVEIAEELELFYEKVRDSAIYFVNQPEPRGFGDAISRAQLFTNNEPFLVHAGDDLVLSDSNYLKELVNVFTSHKADVVLCLEKLRELSSASKYGIVVGDEIEQRIYRIDKVIEKPSRPPSKLAIVAIYILKPAIYEVIRKTPADKGGEIQLTDAIQRLIEQDSSVFGVELGKGQRRLDIGTPESYWETLKRTCGLLDT